MNVMFSLLTLVFQLFLEMETPLCNCVYCGCEHSNNEEIRKHEDRDTMYIRVLQVFLVLLNLGGFKLVKFMKPEILAMSAIFWGSCVLAVLLALPTRVEEEKEEKQDKGRRKRRTGMSSVLPVRAEV